MKFHLNQKVNTLVEKFDIKISKASEARYIRLIQEIVADPLYVSASGSCTGIVFSMDRAIQLHALIESYFYNVKNACPLVVLYRASNATHEKSYNDVREMYSGKSVSFVKQDRPFRDCLLAILSDIKSEKLFFLVDDNLFINNIDLNEYLGFDARCFVPSFRLGSNLRRCYTRNADQKLPNFIKIKNINEKWLVWKWGDGCYDWGYIFSVDGNIFSAREIVAMTNVLPFKFPNTYEAALGKFYRAFDMHYGVCARNSCLINIPCNIVQKEISNKHGTLHQDELVGKWNNGLRIDWQAIQGFRNESAHQDINLNFIKR